MVDISIHGDRVRFTVEGWDKLWALKSHLEIPLAHVDGGHFHPARWCGVFRRARS
jgi:hypothetical protein